ncbi:hypothetical protein JZ751_011967 [Albula glossodonta]|uniref:Uncharacterized protein n=1 Tax=Albula glossodonta TaxID=121402 RepID=A0A8T2PR55_9TELE|nr:hypothetical protein JZ751_011967 [Albula glossodonta]
MVTSATEQVLEGECEPGLAFTWSDSWATQAQMEARAAVEDQLLREQKQGTPTPGTAGRDCSGPGRSWLFWWFRAGSARPTMDIALHRMLKAGQQRTTENQ